MTSRFLLVLALALTGCSTFNDAELAQIRQRDLQPELLVKMERRRPLDPEDVVALKRAGISDDLVVKHLNDVGVNYVVTREDAVRLRKAGVRAWVIDSVLRASERFAARNYDSPYEDGRYYDDPWSPYFYGGWGIGISSYGYGRHHGHRGHRHH